MDNQNDKFKVVDEAGDRKYFTIIPNYILNHSTATAQALYMQLKRLAGEEGSAFPSMKYLMEQLGVSKPTVRKEIKYLLDKGWITEGGFVSVKTHGGNQKIMSYRIVDLWQKNAEFYKGGKNDTPLENDKGGKNKSGLHAQRGEKIIPLRRTIIKEDLFITTPPKKFSSLSEIGETDFSEIAGKYHVGLGFVKLQFEKMSNWLEAKGHRYKNYKRALMNWVLTEAQKGGYRPIEAVVLPKIEDQFKPVKSEKFEKIKKEIYEKIGRV